MRIVTVMAAIVLFCLSATTPAEVYCVGNESALRSALNAAEINNEYDEVRLLVGDYFTAGNRFSFDDNNGNGIDISGGWSNLPNAPCALQINDDAINTVLDGSSLSSILDVSLTADASIKISRLTFTNALSDDSALSVRKFNNNVYLGEYLIERNAFIGNEGGGFDASAIFLRGAERIDVRNNLIVDNLGNSRSVEIANPLGVDVFFTNNTVYNNDGYIYIDLEGSSRAMVANNVLQQNGIRDILVSGGIWYSYHNNVGASGFNEADFQVNNMNLLPRFTDSSALDYSPSPASPIIDRGYLNCLYTNLICIFPPPFQQLMEVADKDLSGADRIQNDLIEIGAYEVNYVSELIYANRFE